MSIQENIYIQRINLVIDYITAHLDDDLSLDTLAQIAGFSPFHFHRIFKSVADEPVNQFVGRVRVEQAAKLLRANPALGVLDAALICGYDSASGFSRAFRRRFGCSARQWNRIDPLQQRKIGKVLQQTFAYTLNALQELDTQETFTVEMSDMPEQRLAYIRVTNSFADYQRIIDAYETLSAWYESKGGSLATMKLYGMSEDDVDLTPAEKVRFDWCVAIPDDWSVTTEISERRLPAARLVSIHTQGDLALMDRAWQYLWRCWLPNSRYQPANLPALEIYCKPPSVTGWDAYDIRCAIPVEPL
jgi:AraC family transcriptional regulator